MHLRPLLPSDIPTLSTLASASFQHDPLFTLTHPYSSTHPTHLRSYFLHRLHLPSTTPGIHSFVCVSDARDAWFPSALASPDALTPFGRLGPEPHTPKPAPETEQKGDREVVLGYAMWTRRGCTPTTRAWNSNANTDAYTRLNHTLLSLEECYTSIFGLDRSADAGAAHTFQTHAARSNTFAALDAPGRPGHWHLSMIATSPIARRRGVGRMLLQWGLERAGDEHVAVGLNASESGVGLYESAGFRTVGWRGFEGGGRAMVWDGDGEWTREAGGQEAWVEVMGEWRRVQIRLCDG